MNAAYIGWHIPRAYEFALASENWHNFEHACFFFTNLMFWWPVIAPWPYRQHGSRWLLIPYLLLADMVNTGLSAFLCFSGRLLYPSYGAIPRPFGLSALNDQIAAGAFMWVMRVDGVSDSGHRDHHAAALAAQSALAHAGDGGCASVTGTDSGPQNQDPGHVDRIRVWSRELAAMDRGTPAGANS